MEMTRQEIKEKFGYDLVDLFYEGLARVKKGKDYFHVRSDGLPAYKKRYSSVGSFYQGLAWVCNDGKYFHIRHNGTPAYKERYDDVGNFCEGVAWVKKEDSEVFFIRSDGTSVD